ncbi:MAG: hypothetical protein R6V23_02300 [Bacteroidales bacterium]
MKKILKTIIYTTVLCFIFSSNGFSQLQTENFKEPGYFAENNSSKQYFEKKINKNATGINNLKNASRTNFKSNEDKEDWLKRVASPTYGLSLGFFNLNYQDRNDEEQEETLLMPGIDLRHFNGTNVSKGGGFYYGYELGLGLNFNTGGQTYDALPGNDTYQLESLIAYRLFLMFKHGYRFNLNSDPDGFSLGLELGLGVMGGGGDITLKHTSEDWNASYGGGGASPIFELAFEGASSIKENVRLSTRLGLTAGMPSIDASSDDLGNIGIEGEMLPIMINLRLGFRMMH